MRTVSMLVPAAACLLAAFPFGRLEAQVIPANTGTEAIITASPEPNEPRVTAGHHPHTSEELMYGRVRDGVYTVDGMVAKLQLNYDVNGVKHLYMFVPGTGTAVLSLTASPETLNTEAKLKDNVLSFTAGDLTFKLTGVALVTNKGAAPQHLYAHLDRAAWGLNKQPMMGFGDVDAQPYIWPAVLPAPGAKVQTGGDAAAPPLPTSVLPSRKAVVPAARPVAISAVSLGPVALH